MSVDILGIHPRRDAPRPSPKLHKTVILSEGTSSRKANPSRSRRPPCNLCCAWRHLREFLRLIASAPLLHSAAQRSVERIPRQAASAPTLERDPSTAPRLDSRIATSLRMKIRFLK